MARGYTGLGTGQGRGCDKYILRAEHRQEVLETEPLYGPGSQDSILPLKSVFYMGPEAHVQKPQGFAAKSSLWPEPHLNLQT